MSKANRIKQQRADHPHCYEAENPGKGKRESLANRTEVRGLKPVGFLGTGHACNT